MLLQQCFWICPEACILDLTYGTRCSLFRHRLWSIWGQRKSALREKRPMCQHSETPWHCHSAIITQRELSPVFSVITGHPPFNSLVSAIGPSSRLQPHNMNLTSPRPDRSDSVYREGSSARPVDLICSCHHQVSLRRSHPAGLHQGGSISPFFCWLIGKLFSPLLSLTPSQIWPYAATSSILMLSSQVKLCGVCFSQPRVGKGGTEPIGPLTLIATTELCLTGKLLN